ncbi:proprotein convertase P-domain-containing protein [Fictibacillus sp. 7GRE50]|uniref:proprotein convertase P-domain-containing protein n=1 Tax=Fictibacillus sp. 7GRE50 TaxID=2745878 RepID=UPI0018CD757B|nr:proprotein convertase P-domain-containing protein [Fictibacillus sp. 7GRE50]MBH0167021.1 proprotein convertase P-domain-containing protein [Fictibacillus sp. 7GRE50]
MIHSCVCHTLKCLIYGQVVVLVVGGRQVPFIFQEIRGNCVVGITSGNQVLALDCGCITAVICGRTAVNTNQFANPNVITIPDSGAATPYPSIINVSGLSGTITNVTVILRNLTHSYLSDLQVLLVGPQGQNVILMSTVGGTNPGVVNVTYTFSDTAVNSMTENTIPPPGIYKPSTFPPVTALPGAPGLPYGTTLSVLNGTNPNGTWQLYVYDQFALDQGAINRGWELTITTRDSL